MNLQQVIGSRSCHEHEIDISVERAKEISENLQDVANTMRKQRDRLSVDVSPAEHTQILRLSRSQSADHVS